LQVAASPCCVKALPNAIAVVLPCVPGPLLQLLPRCCLPFLPLGHWPSPDPYRVGAWLRSIAATSDGEVFWSCSHFFTFRPTGLLASQVAPTLTHACRAAEAFTAAHITVGYLPRAAAMLTIQYRAIDGKGTRTPQIRQTCWLLQGSSFIFRTARR